MAQSKLFWFLFCIKINISTFHEIWLIAGTLDWDASFYRRTSVVTFFIGFVFVHFFQYHGCTFFISNCHTQKVELGSSFPGLPPVFPQIFPWFSPGFPLVLSWDRWVCPGIFGPPLVLGQRDSGTGKTFLSRGKGTAGQGNFFVPWDIQSLGNLILGASISQEANATWSFFSSQGFIISIPNPKHQQLPWESYFMDPRKDDPGSTLFAQQYRKGWRLQVPWIQVYSIESFHKLCKRLGWGIGKGQMISDWLFDLIQKRKNWWISAL